MKLLVGLGNPGAKYAKNRHNVGFLAIDAIASRHHFAPWRKRFQGETAEGQLAGEKCLLLKPTTYMNESGRSVGEAARFYKLDLDDIIVFHDELDLAPGKIRVKVGGGNAGHNGLRSISSHLGNDYTRVRIGIGHPGRKDIVHRYVLSDFAKADAAWLEPLIDGIADAASHLGSDDAANFMNDVARATQGDEGKAEPNGERRANRQQRAGTRSGTRAGARPRAQGGARPVRKHPSQTELARASAKRRAPTGSGKWDMVSRSEQSDERAAETAADARGADEPSATTALAAKLKKWLKGSTSS